MHGEGHIAVWFCSSLIRIRLVHYIFCSSMTLFDRTLCVVIFRRVDQRIYIICKSNQIGFVVLLCENDIVDVFDLQYFEEILHSFCTSNNFLYGLIFIVCDQIKVLI